MPIYQKLFCSHFLAVLLVSGSVGTYFYFSAVDSLSTNLRQRLKNSAALIGQALDAGPLDSVRGAGDVSLPVYRQYLQSVRAFCRTNPDIAFIYVMRREGREVVFVVDSDESPGQALPGRVYPIRLAALEAGFTRPAVDDRLQEDEWGVFMSGYAPLRDGGGRYLAGIDMRADEVENKLRQIRLSGLVSLLGSVLLALLFSRWLSRHFVNPIQLLISRCSAIAAGRLDQRLEDRSGDEFGHLIQAFNSMSGQLASSNREKLSVEEELRQSRDELELRVQERTAALLKSNDQLRHEIAERQRVEEALAVAARTDLLTGLLNRRAILEHLEYQIVRCQRNFEPFCVILADLDHFKDVNDTYGHDVGDHVLRQLAGILQGSCRQQDLLARWGGEEFLLLLPWTDLAGGLVLAEKIRSLVTPELLPAGRRDLSLSCSLGVTVYQPGESLDGCILSADQALYQAKRLGRNRVVAAPVASPSEGEFPDRS